MLAMESRNADADQTAFARQGYGNGPVLAFERQASAPDGAETTIGFRLAFAVDHRAPDATVFACRHGNSGALRDAAGPAHENGALGISGVYMAEANPADFQYYLEATTGQRSIRATSLGIEAETQNGLVAILTPEGIDALFGLEFAAMPRGLRLRAFALAVRDLDALAKRFDNGSIAYRNLAGRLIVDASPGQGAPIAFEEAKP